MSTHQMADKYAVFQEQWHTDPQLILTELSYCANLMAISVLRGQS